MADLVPVHGGLKRPVSRMVAAEAVERFRAEAAKLPKVAVSDADLSSVYRFGDGALSPLVGPMDSATYHGVLDNGYITHGGSRYAWTIPLAFPVTAEQAATLHTGDRVALVSAKGDVVATLDISDVYEWDKPRYLKSVYLTDRTDHPGGDMVLKGDADKSHLIGGVISVLPPPENSRFGKYMKSPAEVRELIRRGGWNRVVAFQTRNPLHRAHEYALVYGLETLIRDGHNAAACLNPLVGETKGDDVPADTRMRTYEALIETRALGEGDSDNALWGPRKESVPDRVMLLGLDIKMFYAGPKEAVMHAIYRQNYGFSDIVIGRKHADAPYHDGTPIWGDFDAQEIFGKLGGELHTRPLKVGFAAYYDSVGRVDLMEKHSDEKPVFISGKDVRKTLLEGKTVDPRIMRESTSRILSAAMTAK